MRLNSKLNLVTLRRELNRVLGELGENHGVDFKIGNMTYDRDGTFVRMRLEANPAGMDPDEEYFKRNAGYVGLEGALGKTILARGERFAITGLRPRGKYRVMAKGTTSGRVVKFTVDSVRRQLNAA